MMYVRFWGTRGCIPVPGPRTAIFGGNTPCVEIRTHNGVRLILDCGTGIRELGLELLRSHNPCRVYLLIGHTQWDHIQGFPFFAPAFESGTELHIFGARGLQGRLEELLAGQIQCAEFPLKLKDLPSRVRCTELEESSFEIDGIHIETQYLNHTIPTIGYRISEGLTTVAYITDHEPFGDLTVTDPKFSDPRDQRHVQFVKDANLIIHDAQYSAAEYANKRGHGHSPVEYVTDLAIQANAERLALFHHDPARDDASVLRFEEIACAQAAAYGSKIEILAAAEGLEMEIAGKVSTTTVVTDAKICETLPDVSAVSNLGSCSVIEILASTPPFQSLAPAELSRLIENSSEEVRYDSNYTIISQGEKAESVYVLLSGRVRVVRTSSENGIETILAELGPREIFGELGVLRGEPRSANVVALEPTRCLKIRGPDFVAVADSSVKISLALLRILTGRAS
jgi:phosphoribosyl 1,2-cyclic phosphodiesterase